MTYKVSFDTSNNIINAKCELVLGTPFPDPPSVSLGRQSWSRVQYNATAASVHTNGADSKLARNDVAYLNHGILLSALAAVLLLRYYRRIRQLLNSVLRRSGMRKHRA